MSQGAIPLFTLARQWPTVEQDVRQALERVFATQQFILGPEVEAFEREVAAFLGVRFAVGVSSGTDALLAALMALGVGPGDEVITSPFTFFATAGTVARLGARPVFVDIAPEDFNLDPRQLHQALTQKTKAIIPVHLFGQAADVDAILQAAPHVPLVEDCAQAIGSTYRGRLVGGLGRLGCFSFFPTKNLGAFGDGGLVTTNDETLAQLLVDLRVHGMRPRYIHHTVGGNFRLDALQAAVLRAKLPHLPQWNQARRENARRYRELFTSAGLSELVQLPQELPERLHTYHQYVVRVPRRDELRAFLAERGIGTEVYYPIPLHLQQCFAYLGYGPGSFPQAERASQEVLALPIFPELLPAEQERVVEAIAQFFGKR
ncbi:MAG: DegT/DnrJ/EryC1/StrS family aminotransferase [Thermoanaerobaculum sp.]|nr:DegT/DnrJ/EryC1/StrS family aminotransferase [Thermoanaerobaculum sp.]